jgi:DNA repair protein RecO (recombination protein O)
MYSIREGLVLRAVKYKESDLILTVLTYESGKITVTARGARKKGSPLAAAAQLFVYSRMVLHRRAGHLHLKEAEILGLFEGLRGDIERMALAGWTVELASVLAVEDSPSVILSLTLGALYALSSLGKDAALVKAAFELRLMAETGYLPHLDDCAVCDTAEPDDPVFDCENGALLCRKCAGDMNAIPLTAGILAAMRHVIRKDTKRLYAFALDAEALDVFGRAAERYVRTHLDVAFPALAFYHDIRRPLP